MHACKSSPMPASWTLLSDGASSARVTATLVLSGSCTRSSAPVLRHAGLTTAYDTLSGVPDVDRCSATCSFAAGDDARQLARIDVKLDAGVFSLT